jgi:DNA-binding MarR family transcriptional regulator
MRHLIIWMELSDRAKWVLGVDRRIIVLREVQENEVIRPAEIAERSGRSVQNISRAVRELEEQGLIECLTPQKRTWKRYLLTPQGREVFAELEGCSIIEVG